MAATSDDIVNLLRQRRIIASGQIVDSLRMHPDPAKLLDMGGKIDFHKGLLTQEIFSKLTELYPSSGQETNLTSTPKVSTTDAPSDLGRVIAPIAAPEPLDLEFRNYLPDWDEDDDEGGEEGADGGVVADLGGAEQLRARRARRAEPRVLPLVARPPRRLDRLVARLGGLGVEVAQRLRDVCPVHVRHEVHLEVALRVGLERLGHHHRPEVAAADAEVDDVGDLLAGEALPVARADAVHERLQLRQHLVHLRHHILAVHHDGSV